MRVYVIAVEADLGIKASNLINASGSNCIISQLQTDDYRRQLADLGANLQGFDMAVVTAAQPALFVIEANRQNNLRAAACRSASDVREALAAGANVIVFNPSILDRYAQELLGGLTGVPQQRGLMPAQAGSYAKKLIGQRQRAPEPMPKIEGQQPERADASRFRRQAQQPSGEPLWDRKKGIKKNIKNIFGVD
jgi:hypothetical protein